VAAVLLVFLLMFKDQKRAGAEETELATPRLNSD
jgi:hypothetical protein